MLWKTVLARAAHGSRSWAARVECGGLSSSYALRVLAAPRREIERAIHACGLARQKARGIQSFLRHLKTTRGRLSLADLRRPGLGVDSALAASEKKETLYKDYKAVPFRDAQGAEHKVKFPLRLEVHVGGGLETERSFKEVKFNSGLSDKLFAKPAGKEFAPRGN